MSTDWYLYSPSHKKKAMVGSIGLGGVKVWPKEYGGVALIEWAIAEHITDLVLLDENDQRFLDE